MIDMATVNKSEVCTRNGCRVVDIYASPNDLFLVIFVDPSGKHRVVEVYRNGTVSVACVNNKDIILKPRVKQKYVIGVLTEDLGRNIIGTTYAIKESHIDTKRITDDAYTFIEIEI